MRLLLTGATGFIGSRLALAARRQHMDVTVTGRAESEVERGRLEELEKAGVTPVLGSLQDPEFSRRLVAGCDAVIHLAAAQHEANVPDSYFEEVNVGGTRSLLDACRRAGVTRFVYGSTIGVYGAATDGQLDETSPARPDNVYGRTKLAAEQVVAGYVDALETTIVRISETYGPGDFRLLKLFRAIERGKFLMIGSGQNRRQVIHVEDLIRGLLLAAQHPAATGETFVLAGHEVMTTQEMVKVIAESLGRRVSSIRLPMWPFLAAAVVLEKTMSPLGLQPPLHRRRLDFFRKSFVFSTDKARNTLGFIPEIPFRDGARDAAAWYRERKLL